ncbi:MAG: CocE/NonD family hydrolase [Alphaproteobacteria bacterium]|nr:CocE/NonD family hydrolase [Alphaproteobacteria bacterium]
MTVVAAYPRAVREIENIWIPLAGGTRLAARVWLPEDAERNPVPAVLEYLPYRKRDGTRDRDDLTYPYFAGHGFAGVRVDMRGNGDSDGLMFDEYTKQEHDDALDVIAWIAAQPWCTGKVGMMGISWGGFNALQVAARRPPALKAIITLCSTDDRYADDVHYMGGCHINENLGWASTMFALSSRPPDPAIVGDRWRAMWLERLDNTVLLADRWTRHQRRDAQWKYGSVCENFADITCAVYAMGGWTDGYTNAIPRLLANLKCPRKGLIGPWAHKYPHFATPLPRFGFLQEAVRWWDHWLNGNDTGIMAEPMLRAWVQDSVAPANKYAERPGRWVAEAAWPGATVKPRRFALNPGRLDDKPGPEASLTVRSPQDLGTLAGEWCPYGVVPDQAEDQRADDARAVCFDSDPLPDRLECLGAPVARLTLAADKPVAMVAVRLCDVAPDGASTLVTYGVLNLTHRDSHEHPTPLESGRRYAVRVQLNDIGHAFKPGHRLRLAVSSTFWPLCWPSPDAATLDLIVGASALELPVRGPNPLDATLPEPPPAMTAPLTRRTTIETGGSIRRIEREASTGTTTMVVGMTRDRSRLDAIDLEIMETPLQHWSIVDGEPLSAKGDIAYTTTRRRGDWSVRVETRTVMTVTAADWVIAATLEAFEGERRVFSRTWDTTIPRDLG